MAKWGECDFSELEALAKKLEGLADDLDDFYRSAAKELAARLLALVIPETPTGKYPPSSGKLGGTLRRGWTAGNKLTVVKSGNVYEVEVKNSVEYGPYVEFGHRTVNGGWVSGQFFLAKSEMRLENMAPGILERKLEKKLREVFGDG